MRISARSAAAPRWRWASASAPEREAQRQQQAARGARGPQRKAAERDEAGGGEAQHAADRVLGGARAPRGGPEAQGAGAEAHPVDEPAQEQRALADLVLEHLHDRAREQAEVGGALADRRLGQRVHQAVERPRAPALQQRQRGVTLADGVDDVVALKVPRHELGDHRRRVLQVAVEHHHGVGVAVVEAGEQRRLLAEAARERQHRNRRVRSGQRAQQVEAAVAAAVDHVQHAALSSRRGPRAPCAAPRGTRGSRAPRCRPGRRRSATSSPLRAERA